MSVEKVNISPSEIQNESGRQQINTAKPNRDFVVSGKTKDQNGESKSPGSFKVEEVSKRQTFEELKTLVRAIQEGETDAFKLTDLIFYARHPKALGKSLAQRQDLLDEWNSISALLVHPTLNEVGNILGANVQNVAPTRIVDFQQVANVAPTSKGASLPLRGVSNNLYDSVIARSVEACPGLSPKILKSLLAQESNFRPKVINKYGYAGIAQFGRTAAREVGLPVGVAGSASDQRLVPEKAIPAAARLLNLKAQRLGQLAFSKYGQPTGTDFWKFVLAAYNGGEGTVSLAMGNAYRVGIGKARAKGMVGTDVVVFARKYASNWENLKIGGTGSPLGRAAAIKFPKIAAQKYHEIGNYPTQIVARAR